MVQKIYNIHVYEVYWGVITKPRKIHNFRNCSLIYWNIILYRTLNIFEHIFTPTLFYAESFFAKIYYPKIYPKITWKFTRKLPENFLRQVTILLPKHFLRQKMHFLRHKFLRQNCFTP